MTRPPRATCPTWYPPPWLAVMDQDTLTLSPLCQEAAPATPGARLSLPLSPCLAWLLARYWRHVRR